MIRWLIGALVAILAVGAAILWQQSTPEPVAPAPAPVAEPAEPHYPVPAPPAAEAAPQPPALDSSDAAVRAAMEQAFGKVPVESFLVPAEFIRRFVALVDSLDRGPVPLQFRPLKHVEGMPAVRTEGETITLSTDNARRYAPWVGALKGIEAKRFTDLYVRWYPLFQKAYEDLGYPGRYFNDRLIKVIDHLLATPQVTEPIQLVRPKVLYQFADPALERLSWGQKALIRMGGDNAAVVKARLREIREIIAANPQKP